MGIENRNLCHESGCNDNCCSKVIIMCSGDDFTKYFSTASEVGWNDELPSDGFFFKEVPERNGLLYIVFVHGIYCPHHNENGCELNGDKPYACKDGYPFAGKGCNEVRKTHNLKAIDRVGVNGEIIYKRSLLEKIFKNK